ncbi:hypothetical protein TDB9533_01413 [Thalassocella blandensis]|nr:hypothetical protein TDB9533_01413 [Thalassocella blandensis]
MRNWLIIIHFVLVSSLSAHAFAQRDMEYFRAEVPVSSQDSKERRNAAKLGLEDVIIRVSGSGQTLQSAELKSRINNAISYVEQFRYLPLDDEKQRAAGKRELLSLTFSPEVVKKLLLETQQPYWPVNRPKTLVWLVEDSSEEGRHLVNNQSVESLQVIEGLQHTALTRGVPLIFPLLDLDDQLALDADDVWMFDEEKIAEASLRYNADVILVGRYSSTSKGEIWGTWQYFHAGSSQVYDTRSKMDEEEGYLTLGDEVLNPLADFLAARYAIIPTGESQAKLVMQIANIHNFGDYYRSLDYLQRLAAIARVDLVAIRQDTMLLYLDAESSVDRLVSVLALDGKMQPKVVAAASNEIPVWQQMPLGSFENPLNYSWVN